jgi:putative ABC transport system permease protein
VGSFYDVSSAALTRPLIIATAAAAVILLALLLHGPHLARIGVRNAGRRRARAVLIVAGLMLSTMFVAAALAVDDTITLAVKTVAVYNLGRVDEDVVSRGTDLALYPADVGEDATRVLTRTPHVAGVAPALVVPNVLVADESARQVRGGVTALALVTGAAGPLGALRTPANVPAPPQALAPGELYLNTSTAQLLNASSGDTVFLYSTRWPGHRYHFTVRAIVTGGPLGDNPSLVMPLSQLQDLVHASGRINHVYIANTGNGLTGVGYSDAVAAAVDPVLPSYVRVDEVKEDGVRFAVQAQDIFGRILALFTLFALSIGLLLIFLIFVLLAAERRAELGMVRALGMRREHIVRMMLFEGSVYDLFAALLGILTGLGLGILLVVLVSPTLKRIGFPLQITVQPQSILAAFALGLLTTLLTVWIAAWTVSRMTVAAALRDLPEPPASQANLLALVRMALGTTGQLTSGAGPALRAWEALAWALVARGPVPLLAAWWIMSEGQALGDMLVFAVGLSCGMLGAALVLRALLHALVAAVLRLRQHPQPLRVLARASHVLDRLTALALGAALVLYWSLPFDVLARWGGLPRFGGGVQTFFVAGVMMVFGAVWALAPNLDLLLRPVAWLLARLGRIRHVVRITLVYPSHHRVRAGIGLSLFSLACFTMVVMACIAASVTHTYDNVPQQAAGYDIAGQPLFAPVGGIGPLTARLRRMGSMGQAIAAVSEATPLPLGILQPGAANARWQVYPTSEVSGAFLQGVGLPLLARASGYASDAAVWQAVREQPGAVVIDAGALDAGDTAALGLQQSAQVQPGQFLGPPIAAGLPGLSSLEAVDGRAGTGTSSGLLPQLAAAFSDDEVFHQALLQLQHVVTGPGRIAPTPIWVTDLRGGPATRLTVVGIVAPVSGQRAGLFGSPATFAPVERGLPPFGNEYYYFKVQPGADPHTAALAVGSDLLDYGFETTVLQDVLLGANGPRVFISRVLVGLVGLTLLVGMAALAVTGSRAVVERRQQIGMLRALGFQRAHVQAIFLFESLLIGAVGTAIGLVLGLVLCRNVFAVDFFATYTSGLTLTVPWTELAIICAAALLAAAIASVLPAWQAGRIAPADALRYE